MGCGGVLVVCLASCEGLGSNSEGDSSVALFKSPFSQKKAMLKSKAAKPVTEFAEKDADDISTKVPSHHDTMSVASRSSWGGWEGPQDEEKEKSGDDSSGKSMDTKSSSKHSKSRAEKDRGPKRKASKLAKAKEHYAKLGKPWVDDPQKHRQLATELATGRKGSVASEMHTEAIEEKREKEAQPTPIEDDLIKEIPPDMTKWIQMVDGEPRCMICQKCATEGHLKSSEHVRRIEEDALGTLLGGEAQTPRRFNGDMCTGVLTKKLMLDFWGDALTNLPKAAMEVHARVGVFYNKKKEILPSDAVYELGVVSYPGQGKYHECNKYIAFHELPDHPDTASEEQRKMRSPKGQGWWPVVALQKVAETTKEGATKTKVLVVCWYQLLDNGRIMCWWIYI